MKLLGLILLTTMVALGTIEAQACRPNPGTIQGPIFLESPQGGRKFASIEGYVETMGSGSITVKVNTRRGEQVNFVELQAVDRAGRHYYLPLNLVEGETYSYSTSLEYLVPGVTYYLSVEIKARAGERNYSATVQVPVTRGPCGEPKQIP
ncbi:MAG: hypothetical protein IT289_00255 [Oligoflexia bacterium]|nr:hypothetical protein [Oligoflexia bacterium]